MLPATNRGRANDGIGTGRVDDPRICKPAASLVGISDRHRELRSVPGPTRVLIVHHRAQLSTSIGELRVDETLEVEEVNSNAARTSIENAWWDVVAIDVGAARPDELELVEWVHRFDPRISVLAVSSDGSIAAAVRAIRSGACDFLTTPLEECALLISVRSAVEERMLQAETAKHTATVRLRSGTGDVIAESVQMRGVLALAQRVADGPTTVMITGPSGTGKEVVARAIHRASSRCNRPFVAVNCAAIPENLLESELFGYRRGAFTGAVSDKRGLFQEAFGGTLLLDEIGDLPLSLQVKLLRVLQEREVRPVGATHGDPVDVKLIAATNRELRSEIARGAFREDLYYRLCVVELTIPALAQRTEDILPLAEHVLARVNHQLGRSVREFAGVTKRLLLAYGWPGNVRELQNVVERAVLLSDGDVILPEHLPAALHRSGEDDLLDQAVEQRLTISELEAAYAKRVLTLNAGNKKRSARQLGIDRRTLQRWLAQPALDPEHGTSMNTVGQK